MKVRLKRERLAEEIARSRLSQNAWARRLGISRAYLSMLVNGRRDNPSPEVRRNMLEVLDLPFEDLFEIEAEEQAASKDPPREHAFDFPGEVKDRPRRVLAKGDAGMQRIGQDLRHALRILVKHPAFTAIALLALTLGIGANTLIYSLVDTLVLHPFAWPQPERLLAVGTAFPRVDQELSFIEILSAPEYADIRARSRTLEDVVALDLGNRHVSAPGSEGSQRLFTAFWWGEPFQTFRMPAIRGRGFSKEEVEQREPVAIVSHRVWQNQFGGRDDLVGDTILIDGSAFTVVGIMPPRLLFLGTDLWMPMWAKPEQLPRNRRQFEIVARLKPGATLQEANVELESIARAVEREHGEEFKEYQDWRLVARSWTAALLGPVRPAAYLLLAAVGFVLLLVCSNVANLLLVRSESRQREMAVRAAMGAGRRDLVRQLLIESALLGIVGGVLGTALAFGGLRVAASTIPSNMMPPGAEIAVNARILLFSAGATLLAALLFGLAPALQATLTDLQSTLGGCGARASGGRAAKRLHRSLVGAEVALAMVLLICAGLLMNSFLRIQRVDPGFPTERLLTMRITLPRGEYQGEEVSRFFQQLADRVEALPGVRDASATSQFPPIVFSRRRFWIEGTEKREEGALPNAFMTVATPGYFETMGIALREGRGLRPGDQLDTPRVAVINDVAAERYFPGGSPLGKRFKLGAPESDDPWWRIVGVVSSTRNRGLQNPPEPEIFAPSAQVPVWNQLFLMARTEVEPLSMLPSIRKEIRALDPDQPVYGIQTVEQSFRNAVSTERLATFLLSVFGVMALILAGVGIYGVLSYAVTRRTQEIGVRMALGADRAKVRLMVVRQALAPVALGALAGLAAALAMGRFLSGLLYGITPADPLTLAACTLVLILAAALAGYLPARRASRVDPVEALRYE